MVDIVLGQTPEFVLEKLRRLAARAAVSNRMINGVMASPPTITPSGGTGAILAKAYALASGGSLAAGLSRWVDIEGGEPVASNSVYLGVKAASVVAGGNITTAGALQGLWAMEFMSDSPNVTLDAYRVGAGTSVRFAVSENGGPMQYVGAGVTTWTWTSNIGTILLAFGSSKQRRIRAEFGTFYTDDTVSNIADPAVIIRRISVDAAYRIWAPGDADVIRAGIFGDSWSKNAPKTATDGAGWCYENPVGRLCAGMGWKLFSRSIGGTGYSAANASSSNLPALKDRLADMTIGGVPFDVYVFPNGTNDQAYAATTLQADALTCWQAARAANPLAPIIIFGPWPRPAVSSANLTAIDTALRAAYAEFDDPYSVYIGTFSSTPDDNWIYGSSDDAAPVSGEPSGLYIYHDASPGGHLNGPGAAYVGNRCIAAVRQWLATA